MAKRFAVLIEPVGEEIVPAPIARVAGRDPIEPLEVAAWLCDRAVVAERDRVASERDV
jgi:hypothetical protein